MSLNDVFESSVSSEFRGTRIASASTLVIGISLITQLMVLSSVAIIMGVAVVTMCAIVVELLLLTVVATVLERGVIELQELGTLMELIATILIAVATFVLASVGGGQDGDKSVILSGSPVAALRLS